MNDDKKQQLATAVKWGVGLLAAASIAIVVSMAVRGLTGGGGGSQGVAAARVAKIGGGGGPSREDRGWQCVLVNVIPIFNGKTTIMVPVYRCGEVAP